MSRRTALLRCTHAASIKRSNSSNYSANSPNYSAKRILRIRQVCERTGLARSTLYKAIAEGKFPKPVAILSGGRASGWLEAEVDAFLGGRFAARDQVAAG